MHHRWPEVHEEQARLVLNMWLCSAVTAMPIFAQSLDYRIHFLAQQHKSPVIAALPPPVG